MDAMDVTCTILEMKIETCCITKYMIQYVLRNNYFEVITMKVNRRMFVVWR